MAASRSTLGNFSSRVLQFYRESHGLRVPVCNLSTSQVCKKKTPHTVGVPAWAKAGLRRKNVLLEMKKPKSERQIQAEFNLENDTTELNLYTTTRRGPLFENTADTESRIEKAKITMSADKTMFVCYHPAKPFPLQFSKDIGYHVWWHQDTDYTENYRDHLTKEETAEVKKLRAEDPKLWTVIALSRMLEVKPLAILLAAPLTDEQKFELEVERKLLNEWTLSKRKIYRANQELERLRYYQETRANSPENEEKTIKSESEDVASENRAVSGS